MVRLGRQIRFSVNPFLPADAPGRNAYCSRPAGEGLALFLQLDVEIAGPVDPQTGFVINIVEIDRAAQESAVPIFAEQIRDSYTGQANRSCRDRAFAGLGLAPARR